MICNALLAARSPPLLSRCRIVFPDEAGTGLTPQSAAKLPSDRSRPGKDTESIGMRVKPHRDALRRQPTKAVHRYESQAAREPALINLLSDGAAAHRACRDARSPSQAHR
jgi:hypothetical protein